MVLANFGHAPCCPQNNQPDEQTLLFIKLARIIHLYICTMHVYGEHTWKTKQTMFLAGTLLCHTHGHTIVNGVST